MIDGIVFERYLFFYVFLFESFMFVRMDLLSREDGASLLATIFMKIKGHRHKVPKFSKRVFGGFCLLVVSLSNYSCRFVRFVFVLILVFVLFKQIEYFPIISKNSQCSILNSQF